MGDLNAMFAEVNNLPTDDPLRTPPNKTTADVAADADEAARLSADCIGRIFGEANATQDTEDSIGGSMSPPMSAHASKMPPLQKVRTRSGAGHVVSECIRVSGGIDREQARP